MIGRVAAAVRLAQDDLRRVRALPSLVQEGCIEVLSHDATGRLVLLTRVLLSGDVIATIDQRFAERSDAAARAIAAMHASRLRQAVAPAATLPAALARTLGRCATGVATVSGLSTAGLGPASLALPQLGVVGAALGDCGAALALGVAIRLAARNGLRRGAAWWLRRLMARYGTAGPDAGRADQQDRV